MQDNSLSTKGYMCQRSAPVTTGLTNPDDTALVGKQCQKLLGVRVQLAMHEEPIPALATSFASRRSSGARGEAEGLA